MSNIKKILRETLTIKFDKAFGLDISDRSVEIIELEKVFRFSVVTYGRAELPVGVIEDGRIINQNILAESIKKLLREAKPRKVSTNKVVVSLPENQVFVQCFTISAGLKAGAVARAVEERASLATPVKLDKTYWDFIEKPLADKTKKMIIMISVLKNIADSYVKFCNSIGLEVVSLCTESLSLARTVLKSSDKQSLIIDIGSCTTNLSFFDSNDKINMSITIPVAGEQMTEAIVNKLKIEPAPAEDLKVKFGFKQSQDNSVYPVITPVLEDILKEVRGAINYYEQTFNQKLDDIYLIGGSALLPGITEFMKGVLNMTVSVATSGSNIDLKSLAGKTNNFPLFANVIGLGMLGASGEFRDMNLLKKMPGSEVNTVNKLNLFKMGYLSKVNAARAILNNKFILVILVIMIGIIFAVLLQQTKNYGLEDVEVKTPNISTIKPRPRPVQMISTSTKSKLGTSTVPVILKATSSTSTKPR